MSRVITFSRYYPHYHPKAGEQTRFVEKFWKSLYDQNNMAFMYYEGHYQDAFPCQFTKEDNIHNHLPKGHTIRPVGEFRDGDLFKPACWGTDINPKSGRSGPYHSKQIRLAPDTVLHRVIPIYWEGTGHGNNDQRFLFRKVTVNGKLANEELLRTIAKNDGLEYQDFLDWFELDPEFKKTGYFTGQIRIWNPDINY